MEFVTHIFLYLYENYVLRKVSVMYFQIDFFINMEAKKKLKKLSDDIKNSYFEFLNEKTLYLA